MRYSDEGFLNKEEYEIFEFFKWAILNDKVSMDLVISAMNAGSLNTLRKLHKALWNFDAVLYQQNLDDVLFAFCLFKKSIKQLGGVK